jgi:hypothetical protein
MLIPHIHIVLYSFSNSDPHFTGGAKQLSQHHISSKQQGWGLQCEGQGAEDVSHCSTLGWSLSGGRAEVDIEPQWLTCPTFLASHVQDKSGILSGSDRDPGTFLLSFLVSPFCDDVRVSCDDC